MMAQAILNAFPDSISQYGLLGCGCAVGMVICAYLFVIGAIALFATYMSRIEW
jgi:hypothetical protein